MSIPAAGKDQRRAVFGALDYASGQVAWHLQQHKDGVGFAHFLERIAQTWPGDDLVLVMDNVSYHRGAAMREWWAAQDGRVVPFWLPAYAPSLNLIERVWRFLKQKLACHRLWADVDGLTAIAGTLLDQTEARFHSDDRPAIRLVKDLERPA